MTGESQQSAAFVLTVSAEMTGRHVALGPETFSAQKKTTVRWLYKELMGTACGLWLQGAKYYLAVITGWPSSRDGAGVNTEARGVGSVENNTLERF